MPKSPKRPGSSAKSKTSPTPPPVSNDSQSAHARDIDALAASRPFNSNSAHEYGHAEALNPRSGETVEPANASTTASTLSEQNSSAKTGSPVANGATAMDGTLARTRVDSGGQPLTTNLGVKISDNQSSLRAGLRGPTLLEDFILREKITHFDHERIPERVVHARGSGAHGYFEAYEPLTEFTRAAPFATQNKRTPVFVRFSTVVGERGSMDTARDVRGFAVKFYTDEGNWDLVGNNIPVFFIQDAIKFPDLVHSIKPEPHNAIPQATAAHDTFWDFVSLMPESTHMLTWVMSDRAIPRSYRMMQGFGVHAYRFVNAEGVSHFVKFHWTPVLGVHSLVWDESMKLGGADPDFHRRDLWDAIEAGEYPEWELGVQLMTEAQADAFSFDILDSTKIVPEELVPVRPVGRMVLNRNPDNFFAETEQVAFCTAHVIPGIDFSNDPLLAGRIHSYVDTQISRLGGPNFHELPINAPLAPVHNNQRDAMHRQAIHRGRVAYEPNSLGGGCPFQAGMQGFVSFPEPVHEDKVRGKPLKFAEHYNQATLFFESQTAVEQQHIINAFSFELSKVTVRAIQERMVASLVNVSTQLATGVASNLGMELPDALPRANPEPITAEVTHSKALSLMAYPGAGGIRSRTVAILAGEGANVEDVMHFRDEILARGAVARVISSRLGMLRDDSGLSVEIQGTLENSPSVLFDAAIVAGGTSSADALLEDSRFVEFLRDAYRHCKTILVMSENDRVLEEAMVVPKSARKTDDRGVIIAVDKEAAVSRFVDAMEQHRHWEREARAPRK